MKISGPRPGAHARRDAAIRAGYLAGVKLSALAAEHGISPARICVIVERQGLTRVRRQGRLRILSHDPEARADYLALREACGANYAREAMGLE